MINRHTGTGGCENACCLKIEHLSVKIGTDVILDDINLHMHCGQIVALIGPNGAGKTTAFNDSRTADVRRQNRLPFRRRQADKASHRLRAAEPSL